MILRPQVSVELIDYRELDFGKFLGRGAEGAVYAAWYKETPVAVKKTESLNELEIYLHAGKNQSEQRFRACVMVWGP